MTTQGSDAEGSTAFLKCFGRQLELLRERAGLTQAELGSRIGYGADQVASVERGRRIPKPEMIDSVDRALEAGGLLAAMKEEVARARYPAFFRDAARLEAEAVELHSYDTHVLNGLLQTEDYAERSSAWGVHYSTRKRWSSASSAAWHARRSSTAVPPLHSAS